MRGALLVSLLVLGVLAGCTEPEPSAPIAAPPEPAAPEAEAVDWSATLGTSNCVQAGGVNACGFGGPALTDPLGNSEAEPTYFQEADGRDLAGGQLTMEWQALTPTTEALRIVVAAWIGCPDECEENLTVISSIGKSPLTLDLPAKALRDEDYTIVVRVQPVPFAQGTTMSIGQAFKVTGTMTFVEPAEASMGVANGGHAMHGEREGPAST